MNLKYLFAAASLVCLTACQTKITTEQLSAIRIGMTREQVKEILGEPPEKEVYQKKNIWFYYSDTACRDGLVTRDECTPFVFDVDEDILIGFGNRYYNENCALPGVKTKIRR